jgi:hypothetical protein
MHIAHHDLWVIAALRQSLATADDDGESDGQPCLAFASRHQGSLKSDLTKTREGFRHLVSSDQLPEPITNLPRVSSRQALCHNTAPRLNMRLGYLMPVQHACLPNNMTGSHPAICALDRVLLLGTPRQVLDNLKRRERPSWQEKWLWLSMYELVTQPDLL